jgi:replicative DNA helicase
MIQEKKGNRKNNTQEPYSHALGKIPPQAVDIEEAVLGALMLEKDALISVIDILKAEMFYKDAHQRIFKIINSLFVKNHAIDILTVTSELRTSGELEMIGGAYYITELTNRVASAANIEYHARIINQKFLAREVIRVAMETLSQAYDDSCDIFELLSKNEVTVTSLMNNVTGNTTSDASDLVVEEVQKLYQPPSTGLLGVGSGFIELDRMTNGWRRGNLITIAARPAMGKTAFMLNIASNASHDFEKPGLIFSLEMTKEELVQRIISAETKIPLTKIHTRELDDYEINRLDTETAKIQREKKLFIDDTAAISITDMRARAKRMKLKHDIEWIMVDYLQIMKGAANKQGNREQEIASISGGLKALAKELKIPVIALSQLSRAVENRPGGSKRPMLSDLRESGSIEQDSDLVLFLYRPEYYGLEVDEDNNPTAGIGEVIIGKNRHGVTGKVRLKFNGAIMKFKDLDGDEFYSSNTTMPPINTNFIIRPSNGEYTVDPDEDEPPF